MKSVLNNPLFQFCLIGVLLFLMYTKLLPTKEAVIRVDQQTIDALVLADQEITQMPLNEERITSLIENFIDEEVLLREAYSREFHLNDYRVRKRLLSLMRSSLTEIIPEPSIAQLRAYYDENREKFMIDESISFETVRFSLNSTNIPQDSERFIQKLENSKEPEKFSEINLYGNKAIKLSYREIAMQYGKEMADATADAELNRWYGPVPARGEIIYYRITDQHQAYLPAFEKIESYLRDDYYLTTSRRLQQDKINDLRAGYTIQIEGRN